MNLLDTLYIAARRSKLWDSSTIKNNRVVFVRVAISLFSWKHTWP